MSDSPDPLDKLIELEEFLATVLGALGWELVPLTFKVLPAGMVEFSCVKRGLDIEETVTLDYQKGDGFEDVLKGLLD